MDRGGYVNRGMYVNRRERMAFLKVRESIMCSVQDEERSQKRLDEIRQKPAQ